MAARLTPEMLARFLPDREVASFACAIDGRGSAFYLKFALKSGTTDVVIFPPAVAFHIRDSVRHATRHGRYRDVRRINKNKNEQVKIIRDFIAAQPSFTDDDLEASHEGKSRLAIGCEVHGFSDGIFIAPQLSGGIYQIYYIHPAYSFFLLDMVNNCEQDHGMVNLAAAAVQAHHRQ